MQVTNEQKYREHSKWTNQADRVEWGKLEQQLKWKEIEASVAGTKGSKQEMWHDSSEKQQETEQAK